MRANRKINRELDEKTLRMMMSSITDTPLRQLNQNSGGRISHKTISGLVLIFNGKLFKGLTRILSR